MNRIVSAGLVREAEQGARVLVLTRRSDAVELLDACESSEHVTRVRRRNGEQGADFTSGGRVRIVHQPQAVRGTSPTLAYIDGGLWDGRTAEAMRPLRDTGCEVIR